MTTPSNRTRDAVVIGGGAAGLSGALMLARARRDVTVVDAGDPRNATADGVHGLIGREGISPADLLSKGRKEASDYGAEILNGDVLNATGEVDAFTVDLADGSRLQARRLLIAGGLVAGGLVDELPPVPGVREQWGHGVLHCPYCHGWEVRDQRIGVLATGPMAVHQALLFSQWSKDVRLFTHDQDVMPDDLTRLRAASVPVIEGEVTRVVTGDAGVTGVQVGDAITEIDAVVVGPRMRARVAPYAGLGLEVTDGPMGEFIETSATGQTCVPGVWAAGNVADLAAQVSAAVAAGALAGAHINADLTMADVEAAVRDGSAAVA